MNEHVSGEDLSAFLDGALAARDRARVDSHLADCRACRDEAASLRHLKLALSSAPRRTLPADLALRLERRLVGGSGRGLLARRAFWIPAGAVAAAALALGLWARRPAPVEELPLEPLLAAHARYGAEALLPAEHLVASSTYSDQMTDLYADDSDPGSVR
jgi:anti-sigma factor RsiW